MKLINCDIRYLNNLKSGDNIICFGLSKATNKLISLGITNWLDHVLYFLDNDEKKNMVEYCGKKYSVLNPHVLQQEKRNYKLIIMCGYPESVLQVIEQLENMNIGDIECYSTYMMRGCYHRKYDNSQYEMLDSTSDNKIPKRIHCCWFSGEPKPKDYSECIDSWRRVCPDYEITEWNADNYDVEKNKYMKQAFQHKAWAFVSDYARLDLIYNYGGIYLDMDVELIKPLDPFLNHKAFFSFDATSEYIDLGSGFGAIKRFPMIGELLDAYEDKEFLEVGKEYSSQNIIPQPEFLDSYFLKQGYCHMPATQLVKDVLYLSPDYVNSMIDPFRDKTQLRGSEYAVHWHQAGWYNKDQAERFKTHSGARNKLLSYNWTVDDRYENNKKDR